LVQGPKQHTGFSSGSADHWSDSRLILENKQGMQLSQIIVGLISCCVVLLSLHTIEFYLKNTQNSCTIILTGESVKILGCDFSSEFIEYAKTLKVQAI